jgi:hypothetical protein
MGKFRRSRKATIDRSGTVDVVTQLQIAIRNPHAALIGAVLGGLVPWFGRTLAHGEIQKTWSTNLPLAIAMMTVVVGCGAFSGLSVYKFGKAAFSDPRKALGFVLALEGVMLVSHGVTSAVALIVLILINAVANGAVIALARDATRRKQEADARGAATRAQRRGAASQKAPIVVEPPVTVSVPTCAPDSVAAAPVARGSRGSSVALVAPARWRRVTLGDVADAEIVSETLLA